MHPEVSSMIKHSILLVTILAPLISSCHASSQNMLGKKIFELFPFAGIFDEQPNDYSQENTEKLYKTNFYEPIPLKNESIEAKNCRDIQSVSEKDLAKTSDFGTMKFYKVVCQSLSAIITAKNSKTSYLPNDLVSTNSHRLLPKDFIEFYSESQERDIRNNHDIIFWADSEKITSIEKNGDNWFSFKSEGQVQSLAELARGDFNGDGIEDALLYIRAAVIGGSHESDRSILVTKLDAEANVTTLKIIE